MARWINKIVDDVFPEFRTSRRYKAREMHKQGEQARPNEGPSGEEVAQKLRPTPVEPPLAPEQAAAPEQVAPETPLGSPEAPLTPDAAPPDSPLRTDLGTPTAEDISGTPIPDEPRTRARNINLEFLEADNVDDIGRVLEANAARMDWGDDPVKSLDQTRKNVEGSQNKIFDDVLTEDPAALSDEQLLAGRDVLLTLVTRQEELAAKIAKNTATQEELLEFDMVADQAVMVQDYMQGKVRAAARALNSMKVVAQTINTMDPKRISQAASGSSHVQRAQTILDMKAKGAKPGEIIEIAGKMSAGKKLMTSIVNLRSGSLLTGVRTQMVNALNNAFHGGYRTLVIKPIAVAVGAIRAGGADGADRVYAREVAAEITALVHGFSEALDIAMSTWKHGTFTNQGEYISMYGGRKIDEIAEDNIHIGSATADLLGERGSKVAHKTGIPQAANMYHRGIEALSFGALTASDDMFKTMAYRSTLYALAVRDASKKGLKGEAATEYIETILGDVSHDFHQKAMREAEIRTFTNKEDVAGFLNSAADWLVKAGTDVPLMRWFFPFVRTPTAILDRSIKNSPLAPLQAKYWETIKAGGPDADIAQAELIAGSAITTILGTLAAMGMVTGNGPARTDDPQGSVRRTLEATGWQANSIRVNDTLVSLKRGFDPTMMVPLAVVQSVEAAQYAKDEATAADYSIGAALMVADQFKDMSFMEGMQQLLDLTTGKINYQNWAAREVMTLTPSMLRDINSMFRYATGEEGQPYVPQADSFAVALSMNLQNNTPGAEPVLVRRYWDGSVKTAGGGDMMFLYNTIMPIRSSHLYNSSGRAADPATKALVNARVPVSPVRTDLVVDSRTGATVDLLMIPNGTELYDELRVMVGSRRRQAVEALTNSVQYKLAAEQNLAGPNSQWAMEIGNAVRQGKTAGTEEFLAKINSPTFDWEPYGGDPARELMTGAKAAELLMLRNMGAETEEELEQMRDLGLRGVPTRDQLAPPEGSGSPLKKQSEMGETTYVPNI